VLLRRKSKADPAIRQFIAMVKNQFNKVIHEFMIDAGGEFKSEGLRTFLKELGINILTSVPHMHQQNGCAKRFIRTIVEKAQAICLEACIPQNWWEFAVNYAVHIYNQTPLKSSSNDYKMPFERLHCTKPDAAHLRVFGCGAYVFLPEDVRSNNLSPRSELMTFIGLIEGTKGYIFMRSPNNVVFTAIQALFDKTLFSKCPTMRRLGYTPVGLPPDDLQGEHNGPPDDENEDYGGGLPPIPYNYPRAYQGPPAYQQPPPPPLVLSSGRGSPLSQYEDNEDILSYKTKAPTPPVPARIPTPTGFGENPVTPRHNHNHPLGWRRVNPDQNINDLDNPEDFKWIPIHHTPSSFLKKQLKLNKNRNPVEYGRLPAYWSPSPSPPVSPRQPSVEPLPAPTETNPPRRSGRIRQPVFNPDNVYGNRPPVDILGDNDNDNVSGPQGNQSPGPSEKDAENIVMTTPKAQMFQDGGAKLINFLLRAAVSSADAKGKIPEVSKVREWHYRDLMHLPKATQEEWKIACKEKLEALRQRNVFKLTNLPKGRKTIGCRWVFDVKSDGHKKARLVAQGFSQVEGIDFNELFSPIVRFESVQLILALSALEDYYCVGVDVHNAYLYGKLDEEIYMRQPEGFKVRGQENKVIRLQCALYGLKQAGLAW
jgi:Reverse transcriptase (RNA-dependent DNA polymerase)